jgi:serine/threonine protein kinase
MLSIAHRDIKPQNILVDKYKHLIVISDFGSAKQLVKGIFKFTEVSLT